MFYGKQGSTQELTPESTFVEHMQDTLPASLPGVTISELQFVERFQVSKTPIRKP
jgi:hypothetical protein